MPWSVGDVEGFNAGLSAAKKRQWVAVANDSLSRCLDRIDGTPSDEQRSRCEASAIRQANGVVKEESSDMEEDKTLKSLLWRLADYATQIKARFGGTEAEPEPEPESDARTEPEPEQKQQDTNSLLVWKEANGQYRWLAVYSNKFRDEDDPPEILSEAAHREFVAAVDKGDWPMPEFWLWHTKGTGSGRADFVAYDDRGFAIASGRVDDSQVGERLALRDDLAVSHGMPTKEIRRDDEDKTVITRYRTSEISALPRQAAANKLTGFYMKEQDTMAFPDNKRQFLTDILGEERVKQLEGELDSKAKDAEGLDFKEQQQAPTPEPATKDETAAEPETPATPEPVYATRQEVGEAVGTYFQTMLDKLDALTSRLDAMETKMANLAKSDEEKVAEIVTLSPAASLMDMIGSVIGRRETLVDGRTKEGRDKPAETPATGTGPYPVDVLNQLFQASWGGKH